jgi:hypothetical protein
MDRMMMPISVAMATYNGAAHVQEQLDSLAAQTVPPAELVVSDDGSSDATLEIIRRFQERASFPIRILDKPERLGFADNFLHAAAACRHELVAFCDQDDVWLPTKLEIGGRRIEADDSLLSMHTLTLTDAGLNPVGHWDQNIIGDRVWEPLRIDPYITGWGNTMVFRRELATLVARERRPRQPEASDRPLSHDTWIYALAAALGRVSHIEAPLILYRQHAGATFGAAHPSRWQRLTSRVRVPMTHMREQSLFHDRMATLFARLADEPDIGFEEPARLAAIRFQERRDYLRARIAAFDGGSLRARLAAYRRAQRLPVDHPVNRSTRLKDLAIGVSGMYRGVAG